MSIVFIFRCKDTKNIVTTQKSAQKFKNSRVGLSVGHVEAGAPWSVPQASRVILIGEIH
jgi:hypothetical protein